MKRAQHIRAAAKRGNKLACLLSLALVVGSVSATGAEPSWHMLAPGMELALIGNSPPKPDADTRITVLRIDPKLWELELIGSSQTGESAGHTARQWCEQHHLTAAINAGMFAADHKTHLGYMRSRKHANNTRENKYQSVAAFDPHDPNASSFRIFDLDAGPSFQTIVKDYSSVVQNLRLIKRPGSNQWGQQSREWSEAALGEDREGRVLFIFSRAPYSMHDLNRVLLSAGIGLVAAQHLEGGPEAQLYFHVGAVEREMFGSFETAFMENNRNISAWPIPNILGVRPKGSRSP
jgi:hypothetical protein